MDDANTILIHTANDAVTRRIGGPTELRVDVLAENVRAFLTRIEQMLATAPKEVGAFRFTEFTVSAEVSADGKLILFGSGVEAAAKGALSFKFEHKDE